MLPAPQGVYRPNFTMPRPDFEQMRLTGTPSTAVGPANYQPNFTMGANQTVPPAPDPVTDVRAKWDPSKASPQAKAWMQSQAPTAAPAAAPTAAPAATSPAGPSTVQSAKAALSRGAGRAVAGGAAGGAIAGAMSALDTPTEDYRTRMGIGPNEGSNPYSMAARDVGVRVAGVASDVGNALLFGLPGLFFKDKQGAQRLTPPDPVRPPAAQPQAAASTGVPVGPMPTVVPPQGQPPVVAPTNVTRVGNSYSGPAGIEGDITINGRAPGGGTVSADGMTAGGGLAQSATDQALHAARMAAVQRGDIDAVRASYGGEFGPKADPVQALMNNGRPMTTRKAAAMAALMRETPKPEALAESAANTDVKRLEAQAARQLLSAQTALAKAKTPAEQAKALDTLRALQGKYEKELPNRFTVVPGGQEIAPDGVTVVNRPAYVINNQTGEMIEPQKAKPAAAKYETNRVYVDGKGNRAKWDGTKFVPA